MHHRECGSRGHGLHRGARCDLVHDVAAVVPVSERGWERTVDASVGVGADL